MSLFQVWSTALSVDNALLVCGYRNNVIEVWDMAVSVQGSTLLICVKDLSLKL